MHRGLYNKLSVIILQTYSKVYTGPYAARIFNHRSTPYRKSKIFFLRLSARPFSGLVVRRILLLWLTWFFHHGCLISSNGVYFYKVYTNTLDICLRWHLSRCPMWTVSRDPILRVQFISCVRASCSWFTVRISQRFHCCPLDWRLC